MLRALQARADAVHADLADAPGGPLSSRVQRDARARRQLHGACQDPELATEVTLQPLARFPLDAAILFSDILTVPDAMGLGLYVRRRRRPAFARPLRDEAAIARSPCPTWRSCATCSTRSRRSSARSAARVPLIGFAGSPFTLACYMIEGGGSDDFRARQVDAVCAPRPAAPHLVDVNARAVTAYLNAQIAAGAQAVMVFDTWGGCSLTRRTSDSRCIRCSDGRRAA